MDVVPYKGQSTSKKQQVADMFDNISPRYDLLNHLLSLGIDISWRKKAIGLLKGDNPRQILDIATGTGDFAIEAMKLDPDSVVGIDISEGMLKVGNAKLRKMGLDQTVHLQVGDSERLDFQDNSFDAVIAAFGVRNFENLNLGLANMYRVLRSGSQVVILEFSKPRVFPFKQVFNLYFQFILPLVGRTISKDSSAYTYLPESVKVFPEGEDFLKILTDIGFKEAKALSLTFGISTIYTARK